MSTVHDFPAPVQPAWPTIAIVALPEVLRDETEPFEPSPEEEAYDLAYRLARDGEGDGTPRGTRFARHNPAIHFAWARGHLHGRQARERAEAYELGHGLGYRDTGISEPPAGMAEWAKAGYREGYAAGLDLSLDERMFAAYEADARAEALEFAAAERDRLQDEAYACSQPWETYVGW